jgi:hypothetical protein
MVKQTRSRCCRRLRESCPKVRLPELPLILAGVIGGPCVIWGFTPMRNALSLAAADKDSSAWQIYRNTFPEGLSSGWVGGMPSAIAACPEFIVMGPLYHLVKDTFGSSALAVGLSGACESVITYGAQTRNAQMAYNQEQEHAGRASEAVPLADPLVPWGPGIVIQWFRNVVASSGIRVLNTAFTSALLRLSGAAAAAEPSAVVALVADILGMLGAACLSAPVNQLYNFAVTSQAYREASGPAGWLELSCGFLDSTYVLRDEAGKAYGLTPTLARDLFLRCMYVANLYVCFALIERVFVAVGRRWRAGKGKLS